MLLIRGAKGLIRFDEKGNPSILACGAICGYLTEIFEMLAALVTAFGCVPLLILASAPVP